jgi:superoxide dismutase, Cu-Zn family
MKSLAIAVTIVLFSSAAVFAQEGQNHPAPKAFTADFINAQGQNVGTATLSETSHGVKIVLNLKDLPPGEHLMHIHAHPKCEPPDFESAGPHFNPSAAHLPKGVTAGDIPNFVLTVHADGTAHETTIAPYVSLGDEPNSVFSNGGTALVIHAIAQHVSASAPPRIACAVISKP